METWKALTELWVAESSVEPGRFDKRLDIWSEMTPETVVYKYLHDITAIKIMMRVSPFPPSTTWFVQYHLYRVYERLLSTRILKPYDPDFAFFSSFSITQWW